MSGALAFARTAGAASALTTLFFQTSRFIGPSSTAIIPGCVIEERHTDRIVITEHPVESGSVVSDHFYRMPAEVMLRWAWSNSPVLSPTLIENALINLSQTLSALPSEIIGDMGNNGYVQQVYQKLLALQLSTQPFAISTGKRVYANMMIESLQVTTDLTSENSLMIMAICKEIIFAQTASAKVPDISTQAQPQFSAAVEQQGTKVAQQADSPEIGNVLSLPGFTGTPIPGGQ